MGALMDKSFAKNKNPKGKFRPWLLRSAPLVCVTFIALWSVPQFFDGIGLLCCLFGLKILYEGCYTMFNIPMGSLLSAMAYDDEERASLSSARGIGSGIGNMLPMVIVPQLLDIYGKTNAKGYAIGAIICACLGFGMCFFHYYLTEERNMAKSDVSQTKEVSVKDIFRVFKVNKPFVALCVHGVFICLMQYVTSTLNNYMYDSVLGDISLLSYGTIISAPFMVLVFIFGAKLAKKLELVKLIRYSLLLGSALYISLFLLHMITDVNPWIHIIWSGVAMGVSSVSIYLQWGLVGDAIDYNEQITGKRTEGSIYGTFNLSRRVGQTIGTSGAMFLLSAIKYDADLPVQSDITILGLKTLCVLLPGIFVLGSWIAFKFIWKINKKVETVVEKLGD
jgi:GPH family glycoside/pentoside/hexuronide:cation symporter